MTQMKVFRVYTMRIRATNFMSASHQRDKIGYPVPLRAFKLNFQNRRGLVILQNLIRQYFEKLEEKMSIQIEAGQLNFWNY